MWLGYPWLERWSKWNFASCFSRLERLGYPIFIKEYAESVGRNGISRVAFPGRVVHGLENVEKGQCSTTENRSTCYERLKKGSWATLVGEQRTLPYWQKLRCFTTNTIEGHWLKIKIIVTLQLSARGVLIFSPLCCREKDFTKSHGLFEFCTQSHSLIVEWDWCSQYESSFWSRSKIETPRFNSKVS